MTTVFDEIQAERERQDQKWGEQNHPNGTGMAIYKNHAEYKKRECEAARAAGDLTWVHILAEEVTEALAESNQIRLRAELLQVAAVVAAWIECIDRQQAQAEAPEAAHAS